MKRREWLRAMRRESEELVGRERVRWLLGLAWVAALGLVGPLVALGVVVGVVGGAIGSSEIFFEVRRGGSDAWIGALVLTVPTALAGLVAAGLTLGQRRAALPAAYAFAALVVTCSVLSLTNSGPVRPFLQDWQQVTFDAHASDHAWEWRVNSAIGALAAAACLCLVARRQRATRA